MRYFTLLVDLVVCVLGFVYTVLTGELGDTILSIKKKVKTITNVEVDTYSHKSDSHTYPYTHHTSTTSAPWMCKLPLSLSQSSHSIIDYPPYLCNCLYRHAPSSQSVLLSSTDAPHSVNAQLKLIYERRCLHTRARRILKG